MSAQNTDPLHETQLVRDQDQARLNDLDEPQPIALTAEIVRTAATREPFDVDGMRLGRMAKDFNPYPMTEWGSEYQLVTGDVVLYVDGGQQPRGTYTVYGVRAGALMTVGIEYVEPLHLNEGDTVMVNSPGSQLNGAVSATVVGPSKTLGDHTVVKAGDFSAAVPTRDLRLR